MMGIWYKCENRIRKYVKVIMFNSLKLKIVSNSSMSRKNQSKHIFKDGSKFLDAINQLFELAFVELVELTNWIQEEY